jgi:hypothetical protein
MHGECHGCMVWSEVQQIASMLSDGPEDLLLMDAAVISTFILAIIHLS